MKTCIANKNSPITLGVFALAGATAAHADDATSPPYSFALTLSSDYIFRGVSQTENGPVLFAWSRVFYDSFCATLGAENVDFNNSTNAGYDASAGWSQLLAGYTVDLGVIRYGYINAPSRIDTVELRAIVSHPLGSMTLGGAVYHTSNYFGSNGSATNGEINLAFPRVKALFGNVALGRQMVGGGNDYFTGNASASDAFNHHSSIDLCCYDTRGHTSSNLVGNHLVASFRLCM